MNELSFRGQSTLDDGSVFLVLQKDYDNELEASSKKYDKTFAIQRCGGEPYEIALRFAGCCLKCGPCFASGYAWIDRFLKNQRVIRVDSLERIVNDYNRIQYPKNYHSYNWMRILGGEPLLNNQYINFLFEVLIKVCQIDSMKFNNGIIIQTNGIFVGQGNTSILRKKLEEIYQINPSVKVCIEVSIKGTNEEEFELITRSHSRDSKEFEEFKNLFSWDLRAYTVSEFFNFNIRAFYYLREIAEDLPNFRPTVIAGFGVNESYLLRGEKSKDRITIIFKDDKPIYHPNFWSKEFKELYLDFTKYAIETFGKLFYRMPMYGIKDDVITYPFAKRALNQGRDIYGKKWYDAKFADERGGRNIKVEKSFKDILDKFFYVDNKIYYSHLINWRA